MKITIIGAGIGGLTTAIALQQKGFEVEIFEAAPEFKRAGSGINLAINAMQVYKELGLYDTISEAGSYSNSMVITDESLAPISTIALEPFEDKYNSKTVAIHRASLHQILLNQISNVAIHMNKKVREVRQFPEGIEIDFEDGSIHKASILIGSDGIHSSVRKSIFDHTVVRKAKQICWRGITNISLEKKYQVELNEAWGRGKRFGFVDIGDNEYYWYALANYKEDYQKEFHDINLGELYVDFHPMVSKIINSTSKESILTNEMLDLKPLKQWYKGNICLLGDAAHATTPNLGQGACQAIESSLVLANCLAEYDSVGKAFQAFQEIRIKKANDVIRKSWRVGKLAHLENRILCKWRNFVLKITPDKIAAKQSDRIFKID